MTSAPNCRLDIYVHESPDFMQEEMEVEADELTFISLELQLTGSSTDYRRLPICLEGVVAEEDTPVLEVHNALTELGVARSSHVLIIAKLFECIQQNISFCSGLLVVVYMEDGVISPGQVIDDNAVDDDDIVYQVQQQRKLLRDMEAAGMEDEFETWMEEELDTDSTVKTTPASEAAIASLEKFHQEEGEADLYSCVICDERREEELARMPCKHVYHQNCLVTWLRTSGSCPLCRFQLPC